MPAPKNADPIFDAKITEAFKAGATPDEMASQHGCHRDTIIKNLVRLGLGNYQGAKYQPAESTSVKTWRRPCSGCGTTKARPKHQFYCWRCQMNRGFDTSSPYAI